MFISELPVVKTCVYNTCERSIGIEDVSAHASENFVAVEDSKFDDIPQSSACGLKSVLLPEYSWGRLSEIEGMLSILDCLYFEGNKMKWVAFP